MQDRNRGVANVNGRVEHEQRYGRFDLRWTADRSSNSYQSALANSTVRSSSLSLGYAGRNPASLTLASSGSDTGFSRNSTRSTTAAQTVALGGGGKAVVRLVRTENGTETGSGSVPVRVGSLRETADINANWRVGRFDAQVQANRNLTNRTVGGASSGAFFAGTERLPDLRLSLRQPPKAVAGFVGSMSLGYGRFLENAIVGGVRSPLDTDRFLFQVGFRPIDRPVPGGWRFRSDNRFQQTVYDGYAAAQYLLEHGSGFERSTGADATWSINYRYLRPYGGTPVGFRLDQSGGSNSVSTAWNVNRPGLRVSFGTAYDIDRAQGAGFSGFSRQPWSNVQLAVASQPSDRFQNRFQTAYDPNQGRLLNVAESFRVLGRGGSSVEVGANYDPRLRRFAQIAGRGTALRIDGRTVVGGQASWSGFGRRFEYRALGVSREFHDYFATIAYVDQPFGFRSEKGVNLTIRLKVLGDPALGNPGRNGTAIDNGLGGFGSGVGGFGGGGFGGGSGGFGRF